MAKTKVITTAWDSLPTNNQKNLENMFSQLSPAQKQRLINTINDVKDGKYTWEDVDAVLNPKKVRDPLPTEVVTTLKDMMQNGQWEQLTRLKNGATSTTLDTYYNEPEGVNLLLEGDNEKPNIFRSFKEAVIGHGKDVLDTENVSDVPEVEDVSKQGFKAQEKALEQQAKQQAKAEATANARKAELGTVYNFGGRLRNYDNNPILQRLAATNGWDQDMLTALRNSSINDSAAYDNLYNDDRAKQYMTKITTQQLSLPSIPSYQQTVDFLQDCASYLDRLLHEIGKSFNDYVDPNTNVVDLYQMEADLMAAPDVNGNSLTSAKRLGYVTKAIESYSEGSAYLTKQSGTLKKTALDQETFDAHRNNAKIKQNTLNIKRLISTFLYFVEYAQTALMNTPKDTYDSPSKYLSSASNKYDIAYNDMLTQQKAVAQRIKQLYSGLKQDDRAAIKDYLSLLQGSYPVYSTELTALGSLLGLVDVTIQQQALEDQTGAKRVDDQELAKKVLNQEGI